MKKEQVLRYIFLRITKFNKNVNASNIMNTCNSPKKI